MDISFENNLSWYLIYDFNLEPENYIILLSAKIMSDDIKFH